MLKLFYNCFKITNENIVLAALLVVFVNILAAYLNFARNFEFTIVQALFTIVTTIVVISAFLSVWLYLLKKFIKLSGKEFVYENDRTSALVQILKSMPNGFGKLFLPFIWVVSMAIMIFLIGYNFIDNTLSLKIINTLGNFNIFFDDVISVIVFITISLIGFWCILWVPEIIYSNNNPFLALIYSIKKILITFPRTLALYLYVYLFYVLLQLAVFETSSMPVLYFIILLLYYYFVTYTIVLIFKYYEQNFLKQN